MLRQRGKTAPVDAAVRGGDDDCWLASLLKGKINMLRASLAIFLVAFRFDDYVCEISARVGGIAGGKAVVGVIADLMLDGVAIRAREDHLPGLPGIAAPPQSGSPGIDHPRIYRIEGERISVAAEIEHAPGFAIIARDVTAGHIGELNHKLGIVRTDHWVIRGAAATGAEYLPAFRILPLSETENRGENQHDCKN